VKETVSSLATSSLLCCEASRFPMRQSIDPLQASKFSDERISRRSEINYLGKKTQTLLTSTAHIHLKHIDFPNTPRTFL
ncbi:hypothetical protein S245_039571, partial [Arachis hypogaea]